jgi:hypothetical protein
MPVYPGALRVADNPRIEIVNFLGCNGNAE